jgi:hypothetical protein
VSAAATTVAIKTGTTVSSATTPTTTSSTNSTAANGVLYAAVKPAAVPAAINTRVRGNGNSRRSLSHLPAAPPN